MNIGPDTPLGPFLRRLAQLGLLIAGIVAIGTLGFVVIEGTTVWNGFFWTFDTIATVGSVPAPTDTGGEILKILLIILGVGTLFYALVTVTEFFVAGHLGDLLEERRTLRMIDTLRDHHVICGFGRVGRQVARDLRAAGHQFVVIDSEPANREYAHAVRAPFLVGSPSDDEMLQRAGLDRARAVLACVDSDAENIFICLTVRELREDVLVVARASVEDSEKKLKRAGADRVISPYKASGAEMARLTLHPQVAGVVDVGAEYRMEEIEVTRGCAAVGRRIADLKGSSHIVGLRRPDGKVEPQPGAETVLKEGEVLIVAGTTQAMERLEELFAPAGGAAVAG
ncbi:MAG: TrkA family potassium uptake protein [Solirubrobacterales bacterium]